MKFAAPLIPGTLLSRYKRFLADIRLENGQVVTAHCPNSGSMKGCKTPGSRVYLSFHDKPSRRLKYTWELVEANRVWVGINTGLPNKLVKEAIEESRIPELREYTGIRSEVKFGRNSRIDLLLENPVGQCYVEIKNVTLVENGQAQFPDAITLRGQKHIKELMRAVKMGYRAVLFFVVQRQDATSFAPADDIDPEYGRLLRQAVKNAGVEILVYQTRISSQEITIQNPLPASL